VIATKRHSDVATQQHSGVATAGGYKYRHRFTGEREKNLLEQ